MKEVISVVKEEGSLDGFIQGVQQIIEIENF